MPPPPSSATLRPRPKRPLDVPPISPPTQPRRDIFAEVTVLVTLSRATTLVATSIAFATLLLVPPRYLEPVYGNVLPSLNFQHNFFCAIFVGALSGALIWFFTKDPQRGSSPIDFFLYVCLDLCALLLAISPSTYAQMFTFSSQWGPIWGSTVTQFALVYPAAFFLGLANFFAYTPRSNEVNVRLQTRVFYLIMHINLILLFTNTLWTFTRDITGHSCQQLFGAGLLISAVVALFKALLRTPRRQGRENKPKPIQSNDPSMIMSTPLWKLAFLFFPQFITILTAIFNHQSNPQCATSLTPRHNLASSPYRILARTESITGWISVVEELPPGRNIRLLRAGHSILGGIFRATGDSVFGAFYFMEAVRLVERKRNVGVGERALQIGLGIGISTSSLQRHNITVDIVEIDPAIYTFARDYFNLTPTAPHEGGATHRAFIQDGRQYIRNAAERVVQMERAAGGGGDNNGDQEQSKEGKKRVASATAPLLYDYVLHDVFTGGSLPVQLFTVEALKDIRKVLKKDGVLALNFAGSEHKAIREPLDIIASTIATVFSHVKCFREPPTSSSESAEAFDNMVFFASVKPLAFRRTIEGDYLGSAMRRHLLPRLTMYPVRLNLPKADISVPPKIVSDKENPLAELQMPLAVEHWRVMREVFPVGFWVNY